MIRENSTVAILVINLKFRNYEKIVFNCYGSAQHDHDICGKSITDYHDIKNTGRGAVRLHFRVKYE